MDKCVLERIFRILDQKNVNVRHYSTCKYGGSGETLLHCWIRFNNEDKHAGKLLLEHGANINATDGYEISLLHVAVSCCGCEMTQWLLNNGAYVDPQNRNKDTPLHDVAACGSIDLCTLLLIRGADPTCKNRHGETPLSQAAKFTNTEVAELLLTYGADATEISTAEMASSRHIRSLCEQNISYSAGNAFIRQFGETPVLLYIFFALFHNKRSC